MIEVYKIPLSITKYYKWIICDMADIDTCHDLLRRLWYFDVKDTYKGQDNTLL